MTYARYYQDVWVTMTVKVCLKRKNIFLNHMYCLKPLHQRLRNDVLDFLKENYQLYHNIDIDHDNIPMQRVSTIESNEDENISEFNTPVENIINRKHITFIDDNQPLKICDFNIDDEISNIEEETYPLGDYRMLPSETAYVADV